MIANVEVIYDTIIVHTDPDFFFDYDKRILTFKIASFQFYLIAICDPDH